MECTLNFSFLFFNCGCRTGEVASAYLGHFSFCSGKPSNHNRNIFDHKSEPVTWLLPKSEGCAYIWQDTRPDLYTWNQLDPNDPMYRGDPWIQGHKTHGKCIRQVKWSRFSQILIFWFFIKWLRFWVSVNKLSLHRKSFRVHLNHFLVDKYQGLFLFF